MRYLLVPAFLLLTTISIAQEIPVIVAPKPICATIEDTESLMMGNGFKKFVMGKASPTTTIILWYNTDSKTIINTTFNEKDGVYYTCIVGRLRDVREFGPL